MCVCEYCKTTILKDADSVKNFGKMSDVLEDYSPIQIGTSGVFAGRGFTVIGRIQLRYSAGRWNEWYVLFDDGKTAWLGDSSGLYTLTIEKTGKTPLPLFENIVPARIYPIVGKSWTAAEVRTADCTGGQGELPFKVGEGWQAKVADFRNGTSFLTLDYSDSADPTVYIGQAVTLEELKCQLLRDDDQVKTSAGKFKGKVDALACPSCGSSIQFLPGVTSNIICPSCRAQVDASGPTAEVLAAGKRMEDVHLTLDLGALATISGRQYQIIGLMQRIDDEGTVWAEYLLYSARAGFLWLIETDDGWARANVQTDWPIWAQEETATLGKDSYTKLYRYNSKVIFAAGAFNWRVNIDDKTEIVEFQNGQNKLAAEMTPDEITWSQSSPVGADQIRAWFGDAIKADKAGSSDQVSGMSTKFLWWIAGLNAVPLLFSFGGTWFTVALAMAAVYFPAKYLGSLTEGEK